MCEVTSTIFVYVPQQVLSSFKGILPLAGIRKDIEANFKEMKKALVPEEGSKLDPQLPTHHINW